MTKTMAQHDKEIQEMEEKFGGKWEELCLNLVNVPSAHALDLLWKDIILSRDPNYGDWEYPGQAYRHLLAEYKMLKRNMGDLRASCIELRTAMIEYSMAVDEDPPFKHRRMMERARLVIDAAA